MSFPKDEDYYDCVFNVLRAIDQVNHMATRQNPDPKLKTALKIIYGNLDQTARMLAKMYHPDAGVFILISTSPDAPTYIALDAWNRSGEQFLAHIKDKLTQHELSKG